MEDYDRLAKLCEKLARDVAERDALIKEKDLALLALCARDYRLRDWGAVRNALLKTLPSEALDRVLAAEREKCIPKPTPSDQTTPRIQH